jgi:putative hemolysin
MLSLEISIVALLIVLNGVFAMSELAVVSSRRVRLKQLAENGNRGARVALRLIEHPGRFLSTVQIGITLIGIFAGAFGGATLANKLGDWLDRFPFIAPNGDAIALAAVVAAITYLSLIVGELVPKRIALKSPERVASLVARPMAMMSRLAAPAVWLLGTSTDAVLRLLRLHGERDQTVSEEEVRSLITEGTRAGIFAPQEKEMIEGVLRLADRTVRAIMTPRPDIYWLDINDPLEVNLEEMRQSGCSRFPVCRGDIDDVVGIVRAKDLLEPALAGEPIDLARFAVRPLIVHDGMPVLRLLELFRQSGRQMAVVVDEYGSVEGLATLTDILESIAGELPGPGEEAEGVAVRREDGSWLVDGMMPIDEFEDRVGLRGLRGDQEFHTLAGFVVTQLGHIPRVGECFTWHGHRFEVVDMDGRRVDRVLMTPAAAADGEAADAEVG